MTGNANRLRTPFDTAVGVGQPISPDLPDGTVYFERVRPAVTICGCCGLPEGGGYPLSMMCRSPYEDPVGKARAKAPADTYKLPATPSPFDKMVAGR